jgi:hypothetical protein
MSLISNLAFKSIELGFRPQGSLQQQGLLLKAIVYCFDELPGPASDDLECDYPYCPVHFSRQLKS